MYLIQEVYMYRPLMKLHWIYTCTYYATYKIMSQVSEKESERGKTLHKLKVSFKLILAYIFVCGRIQHFDQHNANLIGIIE